MTDYAIELMGGSCATASLSDARDALIQHAGKGKDMYEQSLRRARVLRYGQIPGGAVREISSRGRAPCMCPGLLCSDHHAATRPRVRRWTTHGLHDIITPHARALWCGLWWAWWSPGLFQKYSFWCSLLDNIQPARSHRARELQGTMREQVQHPPSGILYTVHGRHPSLLRPTCK